MVNVSEQNVFDPFNGLLLSSRKKGTQLALVPRAWVNPQTALSERSQTHKATKDSLCMKCFFKKTNSQSQKELSGLSGSRNSWNISRMGLSRGTETF